MSDSPADETETETEGEAAAEGQERFVIIQGPAGMTDEEYGRLAGGIEATLPEDMSALIVRGEVSTLTREELTKTLTGMLAEVTPHRLANAEPRHHPEATTEDEDESHD